ncbi:hypothetical protein BCV70DRAFT_71011 [Testicularia cyperi]|uniref:Uncharacterized protein n=1 Tax=Testicularia cyperi TaxID=1882483 RepID=A0A317XI55_9BASI|nr:hypothetical protein BCV70DRAFT_71011 [Testicularia cyperi]
MISQQIARTARVGVASASRRTFASSSRTLSARPDTLTGFREDHAHGPIEGAHPSPEINVARTRSTLRVLVPSVALMAGFIGWWFLGHDDREHRKSNIGVGPDGINKLQGSKHRAAQQLANGERAADGTKIA